MPGLPCSNSFLSNEFVCSTTFVLAPSARIGLTMLNIIGDAVKNEQ